MKSPPKHIPRMSAKRTSESRVYAKRKKVFLGENAYCFSCKRFVFSGLRDLHHFRGRIGKLYLDERFWRMSCRVCHNAIHANRKWAVEEGLLAPRGEWGVSP